LLLESYSKQKPIKFEYIIEIGSNKINIELNTNGFKNYFSYYIHCENEDIEDNITYEMQKIYSVEKPSKILQIASIIGSFSFFIYFLLFILVVYIVSSRINAPFDKAIKNNIYQILLKDNLQQEDYFEIFKYTTIHKYKFYNLIKYDDTRGIYDKILVYYLIGGFVLCIIISLNPKSSFAVGKGINKVKFWKRYYKFVYYIPVFIILPIIISIVSNIITKNIN